MGCSGNYYIITHFYGYLLKILNQVLYRYFCIFTCEFLRQNYSPKGIKMF